MDFSGKNVWVTGAGKGIGYATALAFVEAGAKVTGFDQAFTQEQYPFATEVMDVADAAQVAQVCQRDTVCEHGHCKVLDVIRHHVGTAIGRGPDTGASGQCQRMPS